LEASFDGIWILNFDLRTSFINAPMAEMLGYSPQEMLGRAWPEFLFPQDRARQQQALDWRERGAAKELQLRYRRKNGSELWTHVTRLPLMEEDGSPQQLLVVHSNAAGLTDPDISQRKRAEAAASHLAAIVESSDDAIISKDLTGVITSWNAAATRIFGFTAEEIIGRSIRNLIPAERQAEEDVILKRLRAGEHIDHYETERLTKSGERLPVSITVSPVRDAAGRVVGASKVARDISQRKRTEQALLTSEKLATVGRLAATIAHEINSPLEAVINLVYLARVAAAQDAGPAVSAYLSRAEEELGRIAQLTRQTLTFYRERPEKTRVQAAELLRQSVAAFNSKAQSKGLAIDLEVARETEIEVDRTEFRQLVANLIGNSMDACGPRGRIRVRASIHTPRPPAPSGLRLTVADNGSGISLADRAHVFEPFFTTKKDVGTGLGLWVCKQIVEKYGGSIGVRSDNRPGQSWTAVSIFLPVIAVGSQPLTTGSAKEVA
jgi:PAS domain S-box-containing protein